MIAQLTGIMKNEGKSGEDRISQLSDDVLCHILLFLTTEEAVATSLLSTRWRFLWRMLPFLDIHCSKPIIKSHKSVNTFLALRITQNITRFHLKCNSHSCCSHYVEQWVCAVKARKVEHVDISLCMCHRSVINFATLFTCATLVTLKLEGLFNLSIPSGVHLPKLKSLHLHIHAFTSFSSIRNLISGSPALELFHLRQNWYLSHFNELKIVRNSRVIQLFQRKWFYNLVIQSDRYYDFVPDYLDSCSRSNIVKAKVYMTVFGGIKDFYANQFVCETLKELCNVEFLSLGDFRLEKYPFSLDLLLLKNLVELRLSLENRDSMYMELPGKCPKLEVLEVNIMDDGCGANQRCKYRISGGVREHDLSIVPFSPETTLLQS
ncbi:F-box protein At4g22280 [Vigna radiata var. radiata]|uniref:F-box protein At4g22280 n=1 Tax=Vigna radiata var. radiata TaxID=3916 RepID=A0A1S3VC47_VIGRR|nr:F-box protein At4g22280 [Vigna radiata var. radiata]